MPSKKRRIRKPVPRKLETPVSLLDPANDHYAFCPLERCKLRVMVTPTYRFQPHHNLDGDLCASSRCIAVPRGFPIPEPQLRYGDHTHLHSTGECHTCGRQVSGKRLYCGTCLLRR